MSSKKIPPSYRETIATKKQVQENCAPQFNPVKKRIADKCVCCGNEILKSSAAILMPFIAHRIFDWAPVDIDASWGLITIKNGSAYSICKSLYCTDCRFLFLDIRFSDDELERLYDDYRGMKYNSLRELYEPGYTSKNIGLNSGASYIVDIENFLRPHLTFPLTVLDWGGDTGKNTPFKDENSVFDIYDISNKDVIPGANLVSKEDAFLKKYSLVVCSNVLEHVPYPSDVLYEIKNTMDIDSVLYIETPLEDLVFNNTDDLHLKKKHWHEHINFYSEQSLRRLIENVGLEVADLSMLQVSMLGKSSYIFQIACRLKSI